MPKKTFARELENTRQDNPAMRFISSAPQPAAADLGEAEPRTVAPSKPERTPPEGYKRNPAFVEKRTRRLQLVLQPSLYAAVKSEADKAGISVNDYIHSVLENATGKE